MDVSAVGARREWSLSPRPGFGGDRVVTSLRVARLMFLCDTRRSHWHALGSTPAPKYFGFFLANGCSSAAGRS